MQLTRLRSLVAMAIVLGGECASRSAHADDSKEEEGDERTRRSKASRDLSPTRVVYEDQTLRVAVGALVQLLAVPWAADGAARGDGDVAGVRGFEVRRARVGLSATLLPRLEVLVTMSVIETDPDVQGVLADALFAYEVSDALAVTVGTMVLPYSRSALTSAGHLPTIERSYAVVALDPERRVGLLVEGRAVDRRLLYMLAIGNGTRGLTPNDDGGVTSGARIEAVVLGEPDPNDRGASGVTLAVDGLLSRGAVPTYAVSADLLATYDRFSLVIEALMNRDESRERPTRRAAYGELGAVFSGNDTHVQFVVRGEMVEGSGRMGDEADVVLATAGINVELPGDRVRVQMQATRRHPRGGVAPRSSVGLAIRASF